MITICIIVLIVVAQSLAINAENTCQQPYSVGDCAHYTERFYYDVNEGKCKNFVYSGCGGNTNNYNTIDECRNKCDSSVAQPVRQEGFSIGHCFIEPSKGTECEGQMTVRWYYDMRDGVCRQFRYYTGCGGNQNSFKNSEECEEKCQPSQDLCQLPQIVGPCRGEFPHFYYDNSTDICQPFKYGGCQGNGNRFDTISQCEQRCRKDTNDNNYIVDSEDDRRQEAETTTIVYDESDLCSQKAEPGSCTENIPSWHFDVRTRRCQAFNYSGCQGNDNRFESEEQCERNCGSFRGIGDGARIISEEDVVVAPEGGLVSLECIARGSPEPQIMWSRNGEKISGDSGRMRILEDNTLQIVGAYKTDEGEYLCTASNVHSTDTFQYSVKIQEDPPPSQATILEHANPEMVARLNEPVNIRCFAIGWPRPSITWWRGETMLPFSSEKYQLMRDYSLLIRVLSVRELGRYTCQAYNRLGRAASYAVDVFGEGDVDYSTLKEADADLLQYIIGRRNLTQVVIPPPPHHREHELELAPITTTTESRFVDAMGAEISTNKTKYNQGDEIRLDCKTEGYPPPEVSWLRNDVKLYSNGRILFTETDSIVISNATVTDSGVYTCKAVNNYTIASDTLEISVEAAHLHQNCTDSPFFVNCKLIVKASFCNNKYYARFCCKSCTLAGLLPFFGPHLQEYP